MTALKLVAVAGAAWMAAAAPAVAGVCERAPGVRGGSVERRVIIDKARLGREILRREMRAQGASQRLIRTDRQLAFGRVSTMHWRWFCDRETGLAADPSLRAEALVQGALFLDLADDLDNLRLWFPDAQEGVRHLTASGSDLPTFWNQPLDKLLGVVRSRLNPTARLSQTWYFGLDAGASAGGGRGS